MSVHFTETGYDPDLDYNILVHSHAPSLAQKESDAQRVAARELKWAKDLIDLIDELNNEQKVD